MKPAATPSTDGFEPISYYNPNLNVAENPQINHRKSIYQRIPENETIRFRSDMVNNAYVFLCDTWPDVNDSSQVLMKWRISPDKKPLFRIQHHGGFRTLRHFINYNFFQAIDSDYAELFIWGRRHEAAKIYKKARASHVHQKINKERKKKDPDQSRIQMLTSKWKHSEFEGLTGQHAISLATWSHCHPLLKKSITEKNFRNLWSKFINSSGVAIMALGIYYMTKQNPRINRALQSTFNKTLLAIGMPREEIWYTNSGHNLLGELWMHYRQNSNSYHFARFDKLPFCKGSSSPYILKNLSSNNDPVNPSEAIKSRSTIISTNKESKVSERNVRMTQNTINFPSTPQVKTNHNHQTASLLPITEQLSDCLTALNSVVTERLVQWDQVLSISDMMEKFVNNGSVTPIVKPSLKVKQRNRELLYVLLENLNIEMTDPRGTYNKASAMKLIYGIRFIAASTLTSQITDSQ